MSNAAEFFSDIGAMGAKEPCPDCERATQVQIGVAIGVGVLLGVGAFYALTKMR